MQATFIYTNLPREDNTQTWRRGRAPPCLSDCGRVDSLNWSKPFASWGRKQRMCWLCVNTPCVQSVPVNTYTQAATQLAVCAHCFGRGRTPYHVTLVFWPPHTLISLLYVLIFRCASSWRAPRSMEPSFDGHFCMCGDSRHFTVYIGIRVWMVHHHQNVGSVGPFWSMLGGGVGRLVVAEVRACRGQVEHFAYFTSSFV